MEELLSRLAALLARLQASRLGARLDRVSAEASRRLRPAGVLWRWTRPAVRQALPPLARALGWATKSARPGRRPIAYRDGMVTLDRDGVVISSYYFPTGRRRIPYGAIRGVEPFPLTGARAYRVHGYGWPRHWYHRDTNRGERSMGLVLRVDGVLQPVVTPVDVAAVRGLLEERV